MGAVVIGRTVELASIQREFETERRGGIVLAGPAGVGKSHLAEAAAAIAAEQGAATAAVRATETARNIPLGALASLLPPLGEQANPLAAARAALRGVAPHGARLLLVVDDVQWLDEMSAALLHQASIAGDVFLLLTLRTGERASPAISALWRDRHVTRLNVSPMPDADIVALAESRLDAPLAPNAAAEVAALAAGSPLAAIELVLGGRQSAALERHDDSWDVTGDLAAASAVVELVTDRLGRLDDDDRRLFELVAFGEPLLLDVLSDDELRQLDALESLGLLAVRDGCGRHEAWVAHPLHGEVTRRATSAIRRRAVLRDLVARFGESGRQSDPLRVALWSVESGATLAADRVGLAARRAFAAHRFDLAWRLLDAIPTDDRTPDQRFQLLVASWWVGDRNQIAAALADVRAAATRPDGLELRRRLDDFEHKLSRVAGRTGAEPGGDGAEGGGWGASELTTTPPDRVLAALDSAGATGPSADMARALAATLAGRPLDALEPSRRALHAQRQMWDDDPDRLFPTHPVNALYAAVNAHVAAGMFDDAHQLASGYVEFDRGGDLAVLDAYGSFGLGLVALRSGSLRRAQQLCQRAATRFDATLHAEGPLSVLAHSMAAIAAAQRRDVAGARRLLQPDEVTSASLFGAEAIVASGWLAVAERRLDEAAAEFGRALEQTLSTSNRVFALDAATGLARIGRAELAADALTAVEVQGPFLVALRDMVVATAAGDVDRLESIAEQLEQLGALADAAEAWATTSRLLSRRQRARQATAAAVHARQLLARCEGLDTPGVMLTVEPVALTDRERHVAMLAADRMPAKEIAERLFISQRTVTNHLQRVYEKLGVSSRTELRSALDIGTADAGRSPSLP